MKKLFSFVFFVAAMAGAMSCNKNYVAGPEGADQYNGRLTVRIGTVNETRAEKASVKDFQINSLQLFVFDSNNLLETDVYKGDLSAEKSTELTVNTKTGAKTVYALINNSRLSLPQGVTTLSQYEAMLTDLGENTAENLVMSGKNTVDVVDYNNMGTPGSTQEVDIFVKRLAAEILLEGVTVDFSSNSLSGADFSIEKIYLKNVVGKSPIGMQAITPTADLKSVYPVALTDFSEGNWYNKMKEESGAPACISDTFSLPCDVAGDKETVDRALFTFPNSTEQDSHNEEWDARHTRLVIKAHVTKSSISIDKDTYYVLDLPVLKANTIYKIQNINITMLGKDDDNSDVDSGIGKVEFSITADDWTETVNLNYEF